MAVVEAELDQGCRSCTTQPVALEAVAAVSGDAREQPVGVSTAGSTPEPAGPMLARCGEGVVGEAVECEPAFLENWVTGVGLDGGPDGVRAVVDESYVEAGVSRFN